MSKPMALIFFMLRERLQKIRRRTSSADAQRASDHAGRSPTAGGPGMSVTSALLRGGRGGHAVGAKLPCPLVDRQRVPRTTRVAKTRIDGRAVLLLGSTTAKRRCDMGMCDLTAVARSVGGARNRLSISGWWASVPRVRGAAMKT